MENCRGERRESERERVVRWVGGGRGSGLWEWTLISQNHSNSLEVKMRAHVWGRFLGPMSTSHFCLSPQGECKGHVLTVRRRACDGGLIADAHISPTSSRCAQQIFHTHTPPHFTTCCHLQFGTLPQKPPIRRCLRTRSQKFPAFVKQVETYMFREFARLPGLCNFVAPQYAQTNLKQAQRIKAWSPLAAPVTPVVFHHWSFMQNHHFNIFCRAQATNTATPFVSLIS